MPKQIMTIMVAGLICLSSISGLFTVVCQTADGHRAVEPVWHNHCDCSEADGGSHQENTSKAGIDISSDHSHCRDSLVTSNVIMSVRKIRPQVVKVFVQNLYQKLITEHITSAFRYPVLWNTELSSFFTPLRTVILLA